MGVSAVIGAVGLGISLLGQRKQARAQKQIVSTQKATNAAVAAQKNNIAAASQRAENARLKQARLDRDRQRRKSIREAIIARSTALSNATNQGASLSDSGLVGGLSTIASQLGINLSGLNQNASIGEDIFGANKDITEANTRINEIEGSSSNAIAQSKTSLATGQGLSSLGGSLISNSETIGSIGLSLFGGKT